MQFTQENQKTLKTIQSVAAIVFVIGALFKIMHWPYGEFISVIGGAVWGTMWLIETLVSKPRAWQYRLILISIFGLTRILKMTDIYYNDTFYMLGTGCLFAMLFLLFQDRKTQKSNQED
jgi:DMSO reductase anchor subunit